MLADIPESLLQATSGRWQTEITEHDQQRTGQLVLLMAGQALIGSEKIKCLDHSENEEMRSVIPRGLAGIG